MKISEIHSIPLVVRARMAEQRRLKMGHFLRAIDLGGYNTFISTMRSVSDTIGSFFFVLTDDISVAIKGRMERLAGWVVILEDVVNRPLYRIPEVEKFIHLFMLHQDNLEIYESATNIQKINSIGNLIMMYLKSVVWNPPTELPIHITGFINELDDLMVLARLEYNNDL